MSAVGRQSTQPARFPPFGAWPAMMRADMVAAFFDFDDTAALYRAIARNEAPRPSDARHRGRARESVWSLDACRRFAAKSQPIEDEESIAALL